MFCSKWRLAPTDLYFGSDFPDYFSLTSIINLIACPRNRDPPSCCLGTTHMRRVSTPVRTICPSIFLKGILWCLSDAGQLFHSLAAPCGTYCRLLSLNSIALPFCILYANPICICICIICIEKFFYAPFWHIQTNRIHLFLLLSRAGIEKYRSTVIRIM